MQILFLLKFSPAYFCIHPWILPRKLLLWYTKWWFFYFFSLFIHLLYEFFYKKRHLLIPFYIFIYLYKYELAGICLYYYYFLSTSLHSGTARCHRLVFLSLIQAPESASSLKSCIGITSVFSPCIREWY